MSSGGARQVRWAPDERGLYYRDGCVPVSAGAAGPIDRAPVVLFNSPRYVSIVAGRSSTTWRATGQFLMVRRCTRRCAPDRTRGEGHQTGSGMRRATAAPARHIAALAGSSCSAHLAGALLFIRTLYVPCTVMVGCRSSGGQLLARRGVSDRRPQPPPPVRCVPRSKPHPGSRCWAIWFRCWGSGCRMPSGRGGSLIQPARERSLILVKAATRGIRAITGWPDAVQPWRKCSPRSRWRFSSHCLGCRKESLFDQTSGVGRR